ncbi:unnamed protein product [Boreogadus saida]
MDLAWSVVVLLLSCVFGSPVPSLDVNREGVQPVDDRPIPIDSNSTGLYEDRYDENTTLLNRDSTGLYEDRYDENSTLADRIKTGDDDILLANRTNTGLAKENNDEINGRALNTLRPYEDRYDENSTLADRNKTGDDDILLANRNNTGLAKENNDEDGRALNTSDYREGPLVITRQEIHQRCFLSTCLVHHLPNLLQTGDETAGDKTKDIHGPG